MRYFIELSYHGGSYHGWQKQPNAITVQETIEACFAKIFKRPISLTGAGRTDTGVHAKRFLAHFDTDETFKPDDLVYKFNRILPMAIAVQTIYPVTNGAHARFDAISRTYTYHISTCKNPFRKDFSALILQPLDIELMNRAAAIIKSHRNFQCFSKVKTDVKTYNCKIKQIGWQRMDGELIFTITANRFLRNMVRAIVGTLIEIGSGKRSIDDLREILDSRDRCRAGKSVVAKGLFLQAINYPTSITLQ